MLILIIQTIQQNSDVPLRTRILPTASPSINRIPVIIIGSVFLPIFIFLSILVSILFFRNEAQKRITDINKKQTLNRKCISYSRKCQKNSTFKPGRSYIRKSRRVSLHKSQLRLSFHQNFSDINENLLEEPEYEYYYVEEEEEEEEEKLTCTKSCFEESTSESDISIAKLTVDM